MKYIFCLFIIVAVACTKSKNEACPTTPQYQTLTTAAREWLPYTNNKSLTFENAAQTRDTVEITKLFIGDDSVWVGDKCAITSGQFIRVDFFDKKSKDTVKTQVGLQDELRLFTKFTNLIYYDTKTILIEPSAYRKYSLTLTLDGKMFNSVLALECAPENNCPAAGITKIYFARGKGFIGYVRNGVLWTLK